jgi:hypothetical protein
VRLVVRDAEGRLLLFHTRDPVNPRSGDLVGAARLRYRARGDYHDAGVRDFARKPGSSSPAARSDRRHGDGGPHSATGGNGASTTRWSSQYACLHHDR